MKPHESTSEFVGKLSSIQAKFKSLEGTLKDKVLVRKLPNSFPKKFLPIVASIEQYQEIDTMQFEKAVGKITAFEERLKSQDKPENNYQNKLLLASSNNQGGGRGHKRNFTKNKSSYGKGMHEMERQEERQKARSTSHLKRRRTHIAVKSRDNLFMLSLVIDKDLINLVLPDVRRYVVVLTGKIGYDDETLLGNIKNVFNVYSDVHSIVL
nr:zinc finger, CCHC-type [Tanacetum cinerariifolium]